MGKIDCNITANFLCEIGRMCERGGGCKHCKLLNIGCDASALAENTKAAVEAVQAWSDAHQVKTIMDDLLEKYPNTPLNYQETPADICPTYLGYEEDRWSECVEEGCVACWNRPLKEVKL